MGIVKAAGHLLKHLTGKKHQDLKTEKMHPRKRRLPAHKMAEEAHLTNGHAAARVRPASMTRKGASLGVRVQGPGAMCADYKGVRYDCAPQIYLITPGSPADRAGLTLGSYLIGVDNGCGGIKSFSRYTSIKRLERGAKEHAAITPHFADIDLTDFLESSPAGPKTFLILRNGATEPELVKIALTPAKR